MAIKIHYGANGAYKTSGAIQDDAIPALLAGRVIVTNIRGFTLERAYSVFPNLPDTTEIINLDLEVLEDLEKMRTWFQWAPLGSFIIFDEAQLVFPKSWREKDLERFDFEGGMEAAKEAGRPFNWLDAWTRHRHFGFDIVLTTPNISYIRDDIRSTSETAYRHANLAVIGIAGRYKEAQHDAQLNRPPADGTIVKIKRIKRQTFQLYDSTSTGQVRDTFAGSNLFKSPKVLGFLALLAYLVYSVATSAPDSVLLGGSLSKSQTDSEKPEPASSEAAAVPVAPASPVSRARVSDDPSGPADSVGHPFAGYQIRITGMISSARKLPLYSFELTDSEGRSFMQTSRQLIETGYSITEASTCFARLVYGLASVPVTCKGGDGIRDPKPWASGPVTDLVVDGKVVPVTVTRHDSVVNPWAQPGRARE